MPPVVVAVGLPGPIIVERPLTAIIAEVADYDRVVPPMASAILPGPFAAPATMDGHACGTLAALADEVLGLNRKRGNRSGNGQRKAKQHAHVAHSF